MISLVSHDRNKPNDLQILRREHYPIRVQQDLAGLCPFPAPQCQKPLPRNRSPTARQGPRGISYSKLSVELAVIKDRIDDAVFNGFLSSQNLIAIRIDANLLSGTTSVLRQGGFHQLAHALNLGGLDL